jgi:ectoine hydroxylase-related dioxygenase (phytanoyl-CoA dioxygenase family)
MSTTALNIAPRKPIQTPHMSQRSPYHLSDEQVRFYDENGYLILRKWIPEPLVARLQEAARGWIERGWEQYRQDSSANQSTWDDWRFAEREAGTVMWRVNYLHNKGYSASLELLGSPQVLGVAESLCGSNFVPTYESMVFKQEGDGKEIVWHQDAIHPRNYRIFNLDVYLDPSKEGAGALYVVPKSQTARQDFCDLEHSYGWRVPGVQVVEMEPGDVLLHDVMIAHGSPATQQGSALRRTLYYEFRAAEEIVAEGPWDRAWIDRRMRLLPVALHRHQEAFPNVPQFDWQVSSAFRPEVSGDDEVELKVAHEVHTESAFCSAGDAGRDS